MRRIAVAALAIVAGASALAAQAQPFDGRRGGGREASATLYEFPNFQGQAHPVYGEVSNLPREFNDRAMSARFEGSWQVCENSDFGGRCVDVRGDIPNLATIGLTTRVTSLRPHDGRPGGGGGPGGGGPGGGWSGGGGQNSRPMEGARTVLFAYPRLNGYEVAASGSAANAFCRSNGLGAAVWFDGSEYGRESTDGTGRVGGRGPVLRDVLCRKY